MSPKSDTCPTCDDLNNKILATKDNEEKYQEYEVEKELHLRKAEKGQKNIQMQTVQAKNDSKYHVITFDLQQALPTPKISTRPAFYKRKLWTYNLGTHNCGIGVGHSYVWNEIGEKRIRGNSKLLEKSILMTFMETLLVAISDNCCGENKNWNMIFFCLWVISGRFKRIEQFPVPGDTMLPNDRDFAIVERYVRWQVQCVYSPDEWICVLQLSAKSNPFKVVQIQQSDFISTTELNLFLQRNTVNKNKESIQLRNCASMVFQESEPFTVTFYEHTAGEIQCAQK
ncbi:hypothetical protein PR048_014902 [Dryococelus australis]|uniref:Uncharacterized protein n=1 Tax=Dryococelus australis TaxID=614101 RepID=A0ABQ9HFH0_9NEOP|nr:hypothetical protein PR048_014902 [Dryococelus australis]